MTHLCQWIFMALQLISPEVTGKWAKECGIFNAFDGTDDVLWNDNEEDVMVASSVVLQGTNCEGGHYTSIKGGHSNTD